MGLYRVWIEDTVERSLDVEADNPDDARNRVQEAVGDLDALDALFEGPTYDLREWSFVEGVRTVVVHYVEEVE